MRVIKLAAMAALLATPALAQAPAYQAPLLPSPAAPVVDPLTTGSVANPYRPARVGGVGQNTFATDVDSSTGGNAAMPERLNPNLGNTSGGPLLRP
ncbi:hypothetical protein DK419_18605 [Methylobacterium terrae]|uniref:Uncharacterized protein n=1 Tax=Methylobacterium terrae TaxID=2202827 RepID=A0A2U8WP98_9HYPH|nr:hypothetical protein [Methylobacterium terrae]AWN48094.1 hypothetical protein DK419_18605 [Methylobacterium terrae]